MFNRTSAVFVTFFLVLLATGCAKTAEERFANAKSLRQQGKIPEAIIDLKSALQSEPNNGAMRFLLGQLYNSVFDGAAAAKELRLARKLGVNEDGLVGIELARALRMQGKFEEILKDILPGDKDKPEYRASVFALRGRAQHALGQSDLASRSLQEALKLQTENPEVQLLQAQLEAGKGELENALTILKRVTSEHPELVDGWSYQAEMLGAMGRNDETLVAYQQVLNLNPRDPRALMEVSRLYLRNSELAKAEEHARSLLEMYPTYPAAFAQLGVIQLAKGNVRDALDSALGALRLDPELRQGNMLAAYAHLALGSPIQAEPILTRHVERFPTDRTPRRALAGLLVQSGRAEDALATIQPLLDTEEPDSRDLSLAGEAYYRMGNSTKALELIRRATELAPQNPDVLARQALMKLGSGNLDAGLEELEIAVALTKTATPSDEMLVIALISKGDFERAEKVVADLEQRAPNHAITLNLKGIVQLAQQNTQEAANAFEAVLAIDPLNIPAAGNLAQINVYAGKPALARARYDKMLEKEPRYLPALMALGELEARLGDKAAAATAYERAVLASPETLEPRLKLGATYLALGQNRQGAATAKEALIRFPKSPSAILLAAKADLAIGETTQALNTISQLPIVRPNSASAAVQTARFQDSAGLPREAEKTLRSALERIPDSSDLKLTFAAMLVGEKRFDEAKKFALEVQEKLPGAPLGLLLEGEVYEAQGHYDQALVAYRKAVKAQPTGAFAKKVYVARRRGGDEKGAFEELKQWVGAHPIESAARHMLADVLNAKGDFKSAIAHYETLLERNSVQTPLVLNNLAWAYYRAKDSRAISTAESALKAAPYNANVLDTVGWILLEQGGDIDRAFDLLARAAATTPNSPTIRYHLAAALAKKGETEKAHAVLEDLLKKVSAFSSRAEAQALLDSL